LTASPLHAMGVRLPQLLPRKTARLVSSGLDGSHVSMTRTPARTFSIRNQCAQFVPSASGAGRKNEESGHSTPASYSLTSTPAPYRVVETTVEKPSTAPSNGVGSRHETPGVGGDGGGGDGGGEGGGAGGGDGGGGDGGGGEGAGSTPNVSVGAVIVRTSTPRRDDADDDPPPVSAFAVCIAFVALAASVNEIVAMTDTFDDVTLSEISELGTENTPPKAELKRFWLNSFTVLAISKPTATLAENVAPGVIGGGEGGGGEGGGGDGGGEGGGGDGGGGWG
jgi:hypothetical protein